MKASLTSNKGIGRKPKGKTLVKDHDRDITTSWNSFSFIEQKQQQQQQ